MRWIRLWLRHPRAAWHCWRLYQLCKRERWLIPIVLHEMDKDLEALA